MRRVKPKVAAMMASATLLIAACSGSADPEPPALSTSSESISEADAVKNAEAAATERGLSTQDLEIKPGLLFGEWQVSFEPADTKSLSGGFLVVLNAETGELIDVVPYQ